MTLIDSIYIHNSGGKILLEILLNQVINYKNKSFFFLFDSRLDTELISKIPINSYKILNASEKNRKLFYKKSQLKIRHYFCFSNVPPPINVKKPVTIYFHNDLILDAKKSNFGLIQRIKFQLKKKYIHLKNEKHYCWVVQTTLMKKKLEKELNVESKNIFILPFFEDLMPFSNTEMISNSFLYVANYTQNKNHIRLIKAFQQASLKTNKKLTLKLTLGSKEFEFLSREINYSKTNFELINLGILNKKALVKAYQDANFFIYPSLKESFGLPLIEASNFSGYILASDLDYVHEIIYPSLTFDPTSTSDITEVIINVLTLKKLKPSKSKLLNKIDNLMTHITDYV